MKGAAREQADELHAGFRCFDVHLHVAVVQVQFLRIHVRKGGGAGCAKSVVEAIRQQHILLLRAHGWTSVNRSMLQNGRAVTTPKVSISLGVVAALNMQRAWR